jgi:hypothetical protein
MEEVSENARVWRVYNDEADRRDAEMVAGWTSTLDTLFIFVSLLNIEGYNLRSLNKLTVEQNRLVFSLQL